MNRWEVTSFRVPATKVRGAGWGEYWLSGVWGPYGRSPPQLDGVLDKEPNLDTGYVQAHQLPSTGYADAFSGTFHMYVRIYVHVYLYIKKYVYIYVYRLMEASTVSCMKRRRPGCFDFCNGLCRNPSQGQRVTMFSLRKKFPTWVAFGPYILAQC